MGGTKIAKIGKRQFNFVITWEDSVNFCIKVVVAREIHFFPKFRGKLGSSAIMYEIFLISELLGFTLFIYQIQAVNGKHILLRNL